MLLLITCAEKCEITDGSVANTEACTCGTSSCTNPSGLFCFESKNWCGPSKYACATTGEYITHYYASRRRLGDDDDDDDDGNDDDSDDSDDSDDGSVEDGSDDDSVEGDSEAGPPSESAAAEQSAAEQSAALLTPPQPIIGQSVTAAISLTHCRPMGNTPLPDMPPAPLLSTGYPCDDVYPGPAVLMAHKPSAPPAIAALAIFAMSGVFGVSLGITGILTTALTAAVICRTSSGS